MKYLLKWSVAFWAIGIGFCWTGSAFAAETVAPDQEVQNTLFITTTFRSLCKQAPDPSSLNYYLNVLADGSRTPAEVHAAIETTCQAHSQADACRHVSGLSEICPPAAN
jgi:hypothetical protein